MSYISPNDLNIESNARFLSDIISKKENIAPFKILVNEETGKFTTGETALQRGWKIVHLKGDQVEDAELKELPSRTKDIVVASVQRCNRHQMQLLKERIDPLLGSELLENCKTLAEGASRVFEFISRQLSRKEPLQEREIAIMHQALFDSSLKRAAWDYREEPFHPAAAIWHLMNCITAFKEHPEEALAPITDSTESGQFRGVNASYFLKDQIGTTRFVCKPAQGESQERRAADGVEPGEGAKREHLASVINLRLGRFFPIPYTAFIELGALGKSSVQAFQPSCEPLTDHLDKEWLNQLSRDSVQAMALFDLLFSNTDRHDGNILIQKESRHLFAIDHGGCMTTAIGDPLKLLYRTLPQMWLPFTERAKQFLAQFNPSEMRALMEEHGIGEDAIRWMEVSCELIREGLRQSEENRTQGKVELTPFDLSMLFFHFRKEIWENPAAEVKKYIADILELKQLIKINTDSEGLVKRAPFHRGYLKYLQIENYRQDIKKGIYAKLIQDPYIDQPAMAKKLEEKK